LKRARNQKRSKMSKHKTSEPSFNKYQAKVEHVRYLSTIFLYHQVTWVEHSAAFVHCMTALIITHETTPTSFFCHYYRLATLPANTPTTSGENSWCQQQLFASTPRILLCSRV
uniref:Secreted protein n=1 Tax=Brugia timori TaxID=42155 RepID=A0A0R3RBF8_9BILA